MSGLQIFGLLYLIIIVICFFEAYFYTKLITELRKGLDWFRMNNTEAYMVLLD